jgi:hypothetical protein
LDTALRGVSELLAHRRKELALQPVKDGCVSENFAMPNAQPASSGPRATPIRHAVAGTSVRGE